MDTVNKRQKKQKSTSRIVFEACNYTFLALFSLSIILPFLNVFALSFNVASDTAMGGVYFWPRVFTLANYEAVFSDASVIRGYGITIARTVLGTASCVLLMAFAAYGFKNKNVPGRKGFLMMITFTMLFGGGSIPTYMLYKTLKLTNSFWIYIVPGLYSAWNLIMLRSFIDTLPVELEEAATMDGCSFYRTFFSIILPLSMPAISVIALFSAVGHWNDWFTGSFYVTNPDLRPVQTILQRMLQNASLVRQLDTSTQFGAERAMKLKDLVSSDSLKMATVVVTTLPILCVYPFIQKYFASGVMIGAIKG